MTMEGSKIFDVTVLEQIFPITLTKRLSAALRESLFHKRANVASISFCRARHPIRCNVTGLFHLLHALVDTVAEVYGQAPCHLGVSDHVFAS
jgi:hypothetical protein